MIPPSLSPSLSLSLSHLIAYRSYIKTISYSASNVGSVFFYWVSLLYLVLFAWIFKFLISVTLLPVSSFLSAIFSYTSGHLFGSFLLFLPAYKTPLVSVPLPHFISIYKFPTSVTKHQPSGPAQMFFWLAVEYFSRLEFLARVILSVPYDPLTWWGSE